MKSLLGQEALGENRHNEAAELKKFVKKGYY